MATNNILQIKGDLEILSNKGSGARSLANIFDLIYPVGSVILTRDKSFNPNNMYGGTWVAWTDGYIKCESTEQISSGTTSYLIKDKDGIEVAVDTGASAIGGYKINNVDMLPEHIHSNTLTNGKVTTSSDGNHSHKCSADHNTAGSAINRFRSITDDGQGGVTLTTGGAGSHTHSVTSNVTITNAAVGKKEDNQLPYKPKYYAVIAWQRTSLN